MSPGAFVKSPKMATSAFTVESFPNLLFCNASWVTFPNWLFPTDCFCNTSCNAHKFTQLWHWVWQCCKNVLYVIAFTSLRYAGIRYSEYKKNKDKFLALWIITLRCNSCYYYFCYVIFALKRVDPYLLTYWNREWTPIVAGQRQSQRWPATWWT